MPLAHPKTGVQWTAAYAMSGIPWVTGSVVLSDSMVKLAFPNVTRDFSVSNTGAGEIRVGFTANGVTGSNYYAIAAGEEKRFELRIRDLWLSGTSTFDVVAGVTSISRNNYPNITGSNPAPTGSQFVPNVG